MNSLDEVKLLKVVNNVPRFHKRDTEILYYDCLTPVSVHKIRGQLKLSEKDFKNLITCPLTYEGYLEILKRKGLIV